MQPTRTNRPDHEHTGMTPKRDPDQFVRDPVNDPVKRAAYADSR